jgi:hypothetical protein
MLPIETILTIKQLLDDKILACGISLEYKEVKKKYPSLTREIELETSKVRINSYRSDMNTGEAAAVSGHNLTGYIPDVVDYLRRCDTKTQAKEIIEYLKKQGEISPQYADRLMEQLLKHGVRSFGSKKYPGFYEQLRTQ